MDAVERAWEHLRAIEPGEIAPSQVQHRAAVRSAQRPVVRARTVARDQGYLVRQPDGRLVRAYGMPDFATALTAYEEPERAEYLWQVVKRGKRVYRSPAYRRESTARRHYNRALASGYRMAVRLERIPLTTGAQWEVCADDFSAAD